jgi:hypothetical protein
VPPGCRCDRRAIGPRRDRERLVDVRPDLVIQVVNLPPHVPHQLMIGLGQGLIALALQLANFRLDPGLVDPGRLVVLAAATPSVVHIAGSRCSLFICEYPGTASMDDGLRDFAQLDESLLSQFIIRHRHWRPPSGAILAPNRHLGGAGRPALTASSFTVATTMSCAAGEKNPGPP